MFEPLTKREDLTIERLIEHCEYNPKTGEFYRIKRYDSYDNTYDVREIVHSCNNRGYYWINLLGLRFLVHRLAWLYQTGEHPSGEIDHVNGDRKDNRWVNLRDVSSFDNARNQGERKDNTSGCRGVGRNGKGWQARISQNGTRFSLGTFDTKEEAIDARKRTEEMLEYHPNHAKRESWVL